MRLVSGSWPLPRAIVSLSMMTKSTPTKSVTSKDRTAPALICSTSTHHLAQPPRRRREGSGGRAPEKVPERNSYKDGNGENPARKRVDGLSKVVADRLITGEQRPGLEGHQQEDGADECRHQERKQVSSIENHRRAAPPPPPPGPAGTPRRRKPGSAR